VGADHGDQELYVTAMREVAAELGVALLDIRALRRSHAYAVSQGWAVQGDVHPTAAGYDKIAKWIKAAVTVV